MAGVEDLATIMERYSIQLDKAAADAAARRSLDHDVCPLSKFSGIEIQVSDRVRVLSMAETRLSAALSEAGD